MKKSKKLIVEIANPKTDDYFKNKINEINLIFKKIYGCNIKKLKGGQND